MPIGYSLILITNVANRSDENENNKSATESSDPVGAESEMQSLRRESWLCANRDGQTYYTQN